MTLAVIMGGASLVAIVVGFLLMESWNFRWLANLLIPVGIIGFLAGVLYLAILVNEKQSKAHCERQAVIVGVETMLKGGTCYFKLNDKWYTESTYLEIQRNEGIK